MATINVPRMAVGLKLYRCKTPESDPIPCEAVRFPSGAAAVETVLRRAAISGRVEVGGAIENHFADILDEGQDILNTVALDAGSYRALKTKWMRCRTGGRP